MIEEPHPVAVYGRNVSKAAIGTLKMDYDRAYQAGSSSDYVPAEAWSLKLQRTPDVY